MTSLREKMQEDLKLHGMSIKTQEMYLRAVKLLAEHYRKSPDQITEEELRQYFLYLTNVKHYAPSTFTIALCAIRFFYEHTLRKNWRLFWSCSTSASHFSFSRFFSASVKTNSPGMDANRSSYEMMLIMPASSVARRGL